MMNEQEEIMDQEALALAIENIIRMRSEMGRLTLPAEILTDLTDRGLLKSAEKAEPSPFEATLRQAIEKNRDIKEISSKDGTPRYYSSHYMTEGYAKIIIRKGEDLLSMIAETVRENSKTYPRPVPFGIFQDPPFELTQQELMGCLQKMAEQEDYTDIAQTMTSVGTVFLYSTLHLEPDYASALAEWIDVGQANNP
jgi:hypothetical protein